MKPGVPTNEHEDGQNNANTMGRIFLALLVIFGSSAYHFHGIPMATVYMALGLLCLGLYLGVMAKWLYHALMLNLPKR